MCQVECRSGCMHKRDLRSPRSLTQTKGFHIYVYIYIVLHVHAHIAVHVFAYDDEKSVGAPYGWLAGRRLYLAAFVDIAPNGNFKLCISMKSSNSVEGNTNQGHMEIWYNRIDGKNVAKKYGEEIPFYHAICCILSRSMTLFCSLCHSQSG